MLFTKPGQRVQRGPLWPTLTAISIGPSACVHGERRLSIGLAVNVAVRSAPLPAAAGTDATLVDQDFDLVPPRGR